MTGSPSRPTGRFESDVLSTVTVPWPIRCCLVERRLERREQGERSRCERHERRRTSATNIRDLMPNHRCLITERELRIVSNVISGVAPTASESSERPGTAERPRGGR